MELGQKSKDGLMPTAAGEEKDKVTFPSFSLHGDKMEEFLKECPDAKEVGYELTATVKLKVSGYRDDQYGKDLSLEVQSLDNTEDTDEGSPAEEAKETPEKESQEQAEEPDEEEAMLGYKRPQKENKPAPGASAKDLEE